MMSQLGGGGGGGPLQPGYLPQGMGMPDAGPQGPPGRWHQAAAAAAAAAAPSSLLDGLGTGSSSSGPMSCNQQGMPLMSRHGASDSSYGILSSPSTYGGVAMESMPAMYNSGPQHHQQFPPQHPQMARGGHGGMQLDHLQSPWAQGFAAGSAGGLPMQDDQFPSLLLQQRQQEYLDSLAAESRGSIGKPHNFPDY